MKVTMRSIIMIISKATAQDTSNPLVQIIYGYLSLTILQEEQILKDVSSLRMLKQ